MVPHVTMSPIDDRLFGRSRGYKLVRGNHGQRIGGLAASQVERLVLGSVDMDALFAEFQAYRARVHAIAPGLPVFVNDAPWIMPPATEWWLKWNAGGEIAFPLNARGYPEPSSRSHCCTATRPAGARVADCCTIRSV